MPKNRWPLPRSSISTSQTRCASSPNDAPTPASSDRPVDKSIDRSARMLRRPPTRIELKPEDAHELDGTCVRMRACVQISKCRTIGTRTFTSRSGRREIGPQCPVWPAGRGHACYPCIMVCRLPDHTRRAPCSLSCTHPDIRARQRQTIQQLPMATDADPHPYEGSANITSPPSGGIFARQQQAPQMTPVAERIGLRR